MKQEKRVTKGSTRRRGAKSVIAFLSAVTCETQLLELLVSLFLNLGEHFACNSCINIGWFVLRHDLLIS